MTAARENGLDDFLYAATHTGHPVTRWASESRANWLALREHARALNAEFVERYDKDGDHASWEVIDRIDPDAIEFPTVEPTPRPQAMPDEYRREGDPVSAYRAYYAGGKAPWATWAHTEEPPWLESYGVESGDDSGDADADGDAPTERSA